MKAQRRGARKPPPPPQDLEDGISTIAHEIYTPPTFPKPFEIYTLDDPVKNQTFYIGMTQDRLERYIQHLKGTAGDNPDKDSRILAIKLRGYFPSMVVVDTAPNRETALRREAFWIEYYRSTGCNLTNQHLHIGYEFTDEEKSLLESLTKENVRELPHIKKWFYRLLGYKSWSHSVTVWNKERHIKETHVTILPL